jgi:hypothetical protein
VPHVELSVSEPHIARPRPVETSLARWATAAAGAEEHCLVIDLDKVILAISAPFEGLLGLTSSAIGRPLVGGVMQLLDFADGLDLTDAEIMKTPPLLALTSGRLARGLMRIPTCTLDAVSTPLVEHGAITGSLTYFMPV